MAAGQNIWNAVILGGIFIDGADKVLSSVIAFFIIGAFRAARWSSSAGRRKIWLWRRNRSSPSLPDAAKDRNVKVIELTRARNGPLHSRLRSRRLVAAPANPLTLGMYAMCVTLLGMVGPPPLMIGLFIFKHGAGPDGRVGRPFIGMLLRIIIPIAIPLFIIQTLFNPIGKTVLYQLGPLAVKQEGANICHQRHHPFGGAGGCLLSAGVSGASAPPGDRPGRAACRLSWAIYCSRHCNSCRRFSARPRPSWTRSVPGFAYQRQSMGALRGVRPARWAPWCRAACRRLKFGQWRSRREASTCLTARCIYTCLRMHCSTACSGGAWPWPHSH